MIRAAAVDIGTNSMRLLIADGTGEVGRWQRVTGLGRGVDATGRLAPDAIDRTIEVLSEYGELIRVHGVDRARAVATSATRDAANRSEFLDRAESALGVRPDPISGMEEAALAYAGATADVPHPGPYLVVDIGGGSTEFVHEVEGRVRASSIDIGSVRLTERHLPDRPAEFEQIVAASMHVEQLISGVGLPEQIGTVIGVAGTWTSLAAIVTGLPGYDREIVHHFTVGRFDIDRLVARLASLTVEETEAISSLDPARAPVILAGAVIAREAMRFLGVLRVVVSEHDLLDGVVAGLQS